MENVLRQKKLRPIIGVIALFFFLLILVYSARVNLNPNNSASMSNFATYFSGIITPILTAGTIYALILTLVFQQKQFLKQSKSETFRNYLVRFDLAIEAYEKLIKSEYFFFEQYGNSFKVFYHEIESLPKDRCEYTLIHEFLDAFPKYHVLNKIQFDLDENIQPNCYLAQQIRLKAFEIFYIYKSCYEYASPEDYGIVFSVKNKAKLILHKLINMNILFDEFEKDSLSKILNKPIPS